MEVSSVSFSAAEFNRWSISSSRTGFMRIATMLLSSALTS
jgi:hypothetical protein